jgi:hypothetical protein
MPDIATDDRYRLVVKTIPDLGIDALTRRRTAIGRVAEYTGFTGVAAGILAVIAGLIGASAVVFIASAAAVALGLTARSVLLYWSRPLRGASPEHGPLAARAGVKAIGGAGDLPAALHAQPCHSSMSYEQYVLAELDAYVDAARLTPAQREVFDALAPESGCTYDELLAVARALT